MHLTRLNLHRCRRQQPEAAKQVAAPELLQQGEELVGFVRTEDTLSCRVSLVDDYHVPWFGDGANLGLPIGTRDEMAGNDDNPILRERVGDEADPAGHVDEATAVVEP